MSGRIWPGALCVIVAPVSKNRGRLVEAIEFDPSVDHYYAPGCGCWFVVAGHDLLTDVGWNREAWFPAHWLTPITPPPSADTTEDRSPCEVESV